MQRLIVTRQLMLTRPGAVAIGEGVTNLLTICAGLGRAATVKKHRVPHILLLCKATPTFGKHKQPRQLTLRRE